MLHFYTDKEFIPGGMEIVDYNDRYFNGFVRCLENNENVRKALKEVEGAEYLEEYAFIGKFGKVRVRMEDLSTGTKTIINILSEPNKCFNICECGQNAVDYIFKNITDGYVYTPYVFMIPDIEHEVAVNSCIVGDSF